MIEWKPAATPLTVVGAGPSGLAAAITAARAGARVTVVERRSTVGARFHGDFQGIENWTTDRDVLDELSELGIEPSFDALPVREQLCFGPDGRLRRFHSSRPFYYLVRRGPSPGTLDASLESQAVAAGADLRFGRAADEKPPARLLASGPRRAFAVAKGAAGRRSRCACSAVTGGCRGSSTPPSSSSSGGSASPSRTRRRFRASATPSRRAGRPPSSTVSGTFCAPPEIAPPRAKSRVRTWFRRNSLRATKAWTRAPTKRAPPVLPPNVPSRRGCR